MAQNLTIHVEVVRALPAPQLLISLHLPQGSLVRDALAAAQLEHPAHLLGIFGKFVRLETPLAEQDRIELYHPLLAEPNEIRRRRARAAQT